MEEQLDKPKMSFLGHLEELRWRLVKSAAVIVVMAVVIFIFTEPIVDTLYVAMAKKEFPTYQFFCWVTQAMGMDSDMCVRDIPMSFQSITVTGQFNSNMYMALVSGFIVSFPWVFHQFWGFVKPALKEKELRNSKGVIWFACLLFFIGVLFGYFVIAPLCIQFFGSYKMSDEFDNIFQISSYFSMITTTTLLAGVFFELPVVIYILSKLGVVSPALMRKYRKHALVVILIMSALITPPDVVSQVLVSIPILLLYELGIVISSRVHKRKAAAL